MNVEEFLKNKLGLEVLTDTGWSHFDGLHIKGKRPVVKVKTDKTTIICTHSHEFYNSNLIKIAAKSLKPRTLIFGRSGIHQVVSITQCDMEDVYDLINVKNNHRFYANDVLISNCEFIIFDETLINPIHLTEMAGIDPIEKQGQVRWYKRPERNCVYLVALDPSLGTGGDPAAIQVLELPSMRQVAEWQHNKTPVQQQVKILAEVVKGISESIGSSISVYYSVENNTLGEAALIAISEYGEENIQGIFLSEPKRAGSSRMYRKGFTTTNKSKLTACSKLKQLIETRKLHIASKALISELKTFVASGNSFEAKIGEHDDLVMSMLLAVRMATFLREFDASLDSKLKDDSDEIIMPMPFIMI